MTHQPIVEHRVDSRFIYSANPIKKMAQGLLPTSRVGIIHLFATGPGIEQNALVQISVVRFSDSARPEEKSWILNPRRRITKRLHEKTGLSNKDCTSDSAHAWRQARHEIQTFLQQNDVLFYVDTESRRQWLEDVVLARMDEAPSLVDLTAMAHFFLPGKQRAYTDAIIDSLATKSKVPKSHKSRRVLDGSRVLLKEILNALLQGHRAGKTFEPAAVCFFHYWTIDLHNQTSRAAKAFAPLLRVALGASRTQWTAQRMLQSFPAVPPLPARPSRPIRAMLEATLRIPQKSTGPAFRSDGCEEPEEIDPDYVGEMLDRTIKFQSASWEPRKSQKEYLRYCSNALKFGGNHAIEAGTGTGKTLGYLLPACQFATANPECQVYIASSTKNLAEQLHDHEWPKLPDDIRAPLQTAILLGKRNYLCRFTVMSCVDGSDFREMSQDERLAWLHMFMVLRHANGIIEDIPRAVIDLVPAVTRMRAEFNSESACSRDSCSNFGACTYAVSLKQANEANIVFTNHHKLVLQFSMQDASQVAVLIVDEADQFAENSRTALRESLSKTDLDGFLRRLKGGNKRRGFLALLEDALQAEDAELRDHVRDARRSCGNIEGTSFSVGEICLDIALKDEVQWQRLRPQDQSNLGHLLSETGQHLEQISSHLGKIRESDRYKYVSDPSQKTPQHVEREYRQLSQYSEQAGKWANLAQLFAAHDSEDQENFVHTLSTERSQQKFMGKAVPSWLLNQYAFEIGQKISGLLEPRHATIFTSATLYVDGNLRLFKSDLFGQLADAIPLEAAPPVASEFNHQSHVLGGLMDLFGEPFNFKWSDHKKRQWHKAAAAAIGILSIAMYGRSLVLFTSIRDMKAYYDWLHPVMSEYDVELLIQDGPSYAETELFRTTEHSVLFGVNRFWAGVDFPGQTCSQIIVVRTPNLPFYDPLVKHRQSVMPPGMFWRDYYHPKVKLRFIQQFGRLMRRKSDRGLFITLDTRAKKHFEIFPTAITQYSDWRPLVERGLKHMGFTPELKARGINLDQAWHDIRESVYAGS